MKTQLISFAAACVACVKGQGFLQDLIIESNESATFSTAVGSNQTAVQALGAIASDGGSLSGAEYINAATAVGVLGNTGQVVGTDTGSLSVNLTNILASVGGPAYYTGSTTGSTSVVSVVPAVVTTVTTDVVTCSEGQSKANYETEECDGSAYYLYGQVCSITEDHLDSAFENVDKYFCDQGYTCNQGSQCGNTTHMSDDTKDDEADQNLASVSGNFSISMNPDQEINERVYAEIERQINELISNALSYAISEGIRDSIQIS